MKISRSLPIQNRIGRSFESYMQQFMSLKGALRCFEPGYSSNKLKGFLLTFGIVSFGIISVVSLLSLNVIMSDNLVSISNELRR